MKHSRLDTLGDLSKQEYCFTDNEPDPIDSIDLITGDRVADEYPEGINDVTLQLGEDYPGLELPSFIGNTDSMLIVSREAVDVIQTHDVGEMEVIPFKLINHKGRVHSDDYVFLNPIGARDCLDMDKTECKRYDDGEIMKITKYVLSETKLEGAPHLFRVREKPGNYICSDFLIAALAEKGCTNFVYEELEQY